MQLKTGLSSQQFSSSLQRPSVLTMHRSSPGGLSEQGCWPDWGNVPGGDPKECQKLLQLRESCDTRIPKDQGVVVLSTLSLPSVAFALFLRDSAPGVLPGGDWVGSGFSSLHINPPLYK